MTDKTAREAVDQMRDRGARAAVYGESLDRIRASVGVLETADEMDHAAWRDASMELIRHAATLYGRACAIVATDETASLLVEFIEAAERREDPYAAAAARREAVWAEAAVRQRCESEVITDAEVQRRRDHDERARQADIVERTRRSDWDAGHPGGLD